MSDGLVERLREALPAFAFERELGGGGMSRVFLAEEKALGRRVVVKVLGAVTGSVNADRFRREILLSARLQHPNIVPVLGAGEVDGVPWFTMPYVEGESLRGRLRRDGPLGVAEGTRLLRNVAAALGYAHERGVVHRDIKPDNVMVSGGVAVVLDFGVSKALDVSRLPGGGELTTSGIAVGTPAYMSPEQVAGDPEVDARADLYALGTLAYEMFTATTPFGGREPAQLMRAQLLEAPPPIHTRRAELPGPVAALIMRCLEKERTARPQSAAEILDRLDAMATPASMPAMGESVRRASAGALAAAIPALVYVVACGAMFAGLQWLAGQGQIETRVVVMSAIAALLGLPVVVAAGLLLHLRRMEGVGGQGSGVRATA